MIPVSAIRRKSHFWLTEEAWINRCSTFSPGIPLNDMKLSPCKRYDVREGSFWVSLSGKVFRVCNSKGYPMGSRINSEGNWEFRKSLKEEYKQMYFEPISPLHILFRTL